MPAPGPARPNLYVIARFLDRIAERPARTRTRLQLAVRLNYDLFVHYLDLLEAKGHVLWRDTPGGAVAELTPSGEALRARLGGLLREWLG
jgi:predicted transcriptional regulator